MTDDRAVAIALLTSLSLGDRQELASVNDPVLGAALLKSYALANEKVDRSTLAQVEAYLSTISADDWLSLLKSIVPVLLPLL